MVEARGVAKRVKRTGRPVKLNFTLKPTFRQEQRTTVYAKHPLPPNTPKKGSDNSVFRLQPGRRLFVGCPLLWLLLLIARKANPRKIVGGYTRGRGAWGYIFLFLVIRE